RVHTGRPTRKTGPQSSTNRTAVLCEQGFGSVRTGLGSSTDRNPLPYAEDGGPVSRARRSCLASPESYAVRTSVLFVEDLRPRTRTPTPKRTPSRPSV